MYQGYGLMRSHCARPLGAACLASLTVRAAPTHRLNARPRLSALTAAAATASALRAYLRLQTSTVTGVTPARCWHCRVHGLRVQPQTLLVEFLPQVSAARLVLVAVAGAPELLTAPEAVAGLAGLR